MRRLLVCLIALAALAVPAAAQAAIITVTTTEPLSTTACSLPDAIFASNQDEPSRGCPAGNGADQIEFDLPLPAKIVTETPLQVNNGSVVSIDGPGAGLLTVSGNDKSRVFEVGNEEGKNGETGDLTLSDLTISDGFATEIGAGLYVQYFSAARLTGVTISDNEVKGSGTFAEGAGIMNQGEVTLIESTISGNTARNINAAAASEANGAGITSERTKLTIERSTIDNNTSVVENTVENGISRGGGLFAWILTDLIVRDSTITGNKSEINAGTGNQAVGGGISLFPTPNATIESSTVADNAAPLGANLFTEGAAVLRSTILARPLGGANCAKAAAGTITSAGFNLDEGSSCEFGAQDQSGVNPLLAPALAANGGPTETLALLSGSPAVDHGVAAAGETVDQRGFRRPVEIPSVPNAPGGDGADVGAYEVQVPRATITRGPGDGETIRDDRPVFDFIADGPSAGFVCSVDGAAPTQCSSPFQSPTLANGSHSFSVAALGEAGYAGEAATRTFNVDVRQEVRPRDETHTNPPAKQVSPKARLGTLPARTTKRRLTIRFSVNQAGSSFRCKLDSRSWRRCRSPYTTPRLQLGKHVFRVKATGPTGLVQQKPATRSFRVVAP